MDLVLPGLVGAVLALGVFVLGRLTRLDRDRAFYPTILIVMPLYYDLFAVLGGSNRALILESLVFCVFLTVAVLGFRGNLWIVAVGLPAHGLWDLIHGYLIHNPGVPHWWPPFCLAYDVVAGAGLAWLLWRSAVRARPV
jgi:hypothetical protein